MKTWHLRFAVILSTLAVLAVAIWWSMRPIVHRLDGAWAMEIKIRDEVEVGQSKKGGFIDQIFDSVLDSIDSQLAMRTEFHSANEEEGELE